MLTQCLSKPTQMEFGGIKRILRLAVQDAYPTSSDDDFTQYMERRGWTVGTIAAMKDNIARKMTVDMFGHVDPLSKEEERYQRDADAFLQNAK